jgi:ribosomal protein L34
MCIFLILARRRLYGGIRMSFAGRENENDRSRMVTEHGNELCAGRRESER